MGKRSKGSPTERGMGVKFKKDKFSWKKPHNDEANQLPMPKINKIMTRHPITTKRKGPSFKDLLNEVANDD